METLNNKNALLLRIVSENNNLKAKLRKAPMDEKQAWGEAVKRVVTLGEEVLDYANFLTEDELRDFYNLYRTAIYITSPRMSPREVRAKSAEQFMTIIMGQEDLLHRIIIPALPQDKTFEDKKAIREQMDGITYNLNYLEVSFLFIDKKIDTVVASQANLSEAQKKELKIKLSNEFKKLRELTNYVREYYDGAKKIVEEVLAGYVTDEEMKEIKDQLDTIELMTNRISSSFTTKSVTRINNNTKAVEDMLTKSRGR